jgi:glycosyltransferase involved in cell wall biosynthesis
MRAKARLANALAPGESSVRKVLYVSHNHQSVKPGGLEVYADELYNAVKAAGQFEPFFLARVGERLSAGRPHHGTRLALSDDDPNLYYIHTEREEFDSFMWTSTDKRLYTEDWRSFLQAIKPDVLHFHHSAWLGFDMLREAKQTLPETPIVYTLHDFVPICHHLGQMVRTYNDGLCYEATPRRCHQCFPRITVQQFFLRERFIKSALEAVDMFIAPSRLVRDRFIDWGVAPDRIRYEDNGRTAVTALPDPPDAGRRRRLGFFGQITRFKGLDLLLEAMKLLHARGTVAELWVHGANLEFAREELRSRITDLLEEASAAVRFVGRYQRGELTRRMAGVDWVVIPSTWWENAPLVIQEAWMCRRPVICGNVGGMAEKVRNGVDGLHFRFHDPYDLADTIERAVNSPELWETLRDGITDPYPMAAHLEAITAIYEDLLGPRPAALSRRAASASASLTVQGP